MKELLVKCGAYKHNEEKINFSKNYDGRYLVNDHFYYWVIGAYRLIRVRFINLLGLDDTLRIATGFNTYPKISYGCREQA